MNTLVTPKHLGASSRTIVPPVNGWKENTYYSVEVAFKPTNTVHSSIFFSGFLKDGKPGSYNAVFNPSYENNFKISDVFYLKAGRVIEL